MHHIIKKNILGWSNKKVVENYRKATEKGLWESEKYFIKKYFRKNSSVLDIGCGMGRTTFGLKKLGYNVIGVDITHSMIREAEKFNKKYKEHISFHVMDATKLKFKDQSFDNAIFSFNGLMQIPGENNRIKAMKEIYRVLKPQGYFIFTTHTKESKMLKWILKAIPFYFKKIIGIKSEEIDFGDVFFTGGAAGYSQKQFIHCPSSFRIKTLLEKIGFIIINGGWRNRISNKDAKLPSANTYFWVVRK